MNIEYIKVGNLKCNCYLIEKENNYLLIDPGDDIEAIEKFIQGKTIQGILLTHFHFDHTASVEDLVEKYHYKVYNDNNLKVGENKIANFNFEVIPTPGHTTDSITYYFKEDKVMFTGDFLFYQTIGRCDLIESNPSQMEKSISKIQDYPNDITIYPGHGIKTNLGYEKSHNPYF